MRRSFARYIAKQLLILAAGGIMLQSSACATQLSSLAYSFASTLVSALAIEVANQTISGDTDSAT